MPQHPRLHTFTKIQETGLIPLFYHENTEICLNLCKSCIDGGAFVIEFLNRGPGALDKFKHLMDYCNTHYPHAILGIGSILDAPTAALFIAEGANFIVSPCLDEEVLTLCHKRKIAYLPGCATMTEIHHAESLGVEICKLFPGGSIGSSFVKAALGPSPHSLLMPTGGVKPTEESLRTWFDAGVCCVGMGSQLITKDIIEHQKFSELKENISNCLDLINTHRKK